MALRPRTFAEAENHTGGSRRPHRIDGPLGSLLALLVLCSACTAQGAAPPPAAPDQDISFLSLTVDEETSKADTRLQRFLESLIFKPGAQQRLPSQTMGYGELIRALAEREQGRAYVARVTPYAYVVAEMLGAKLDILATYLSGATNDFTYHAYFVVPTEAFNEKVKAGANGAPPTLDQLGVYLKALRSKPAQFIYHDRFSTSSYFLPSLYFKRNHVFAGTESGNSENIRINVSRFPTSSSSRLVCEVAGGRADLAAVWSGTRAKFFVRGPDGVQTPVPVADECPGATHRVEFIQITQDIPNDFLVASGLEQPMRDAIVEGIKKYPLALRPCTSLEPERQPASGEADKRCGIVFKDHRADGPADDFDSWHVWGDVDREVSDRPREALAELRESAHQTRVPVVVKVVGNACKQQAQDACVPPSYLEAAKAAVRLSGTEFVMYDPFLHRRTDLTWTLASSHDGALTLVSALECTLDGGTDGADVPFERSESVPISFSDTSDLPQRIADIARTRLRRIRYVWPYEDKYPAVLRDLDFTPDRRVLVQKITWLDEKRNAYSEDTPFHTTIVNNGDLDKFRLNDNFRFPRNGDSELGFDPMSNVAYRVIISRLPNPSWIWQWLPGGFIALIALAMVGFIVDLRRQQPPPTGLLQTYQRMVAELRSPWRHYAIEENNIIWSDPKYIDEFIKETKTTATGSLLDEVRKGTLDTSLWGIPLKFSLLVRLWTGLFASRYTQLASELQDSSAIGRVGALDMLLQYLVRKGQLSPLVGFPESIAAKGGARPSAAPMEWEALNRIASRHFHHIGTDGHRAGSARKDIDAMLAPQTGALVDTVSSHFRGVLKRAQAAHTASFFCQTWDVGETDRLVYEREMHSPLALGNDYGPVARVRLTVTMEPGTVLRDVPAGARPNAWVLGRVVKLSGCDQGTVVVEIKPMAILKRTDDDSQQ
jgi:ABC-type phosphate/phosphonate transport system substrate-binding protein